MEKIETLSAHFNFGDTVSVPDGYDLHTIPEATSADMEVLMNKINELTERVNTLSGDE